MALATVLKALFIPIKTLQKAIKGFLAKICQFSNLIDFFCEWFWKEAKSTLKLFFRNLCKFCWSFSSTAYIANIT